MMDNTALFYVFIFYFSNQFDMFIEFRKYKFVTGTTKKRLVTSFTHKYNRQKKVYIRHI